jgi:hypothetical protein
VMARKAALLVESRLAAGHDETEGASSIWGNVELRSSTVAIEPAR